MSAILRMLNFKFRLWVYFGKGEILVLWKAESLKDNLIALALRLLNECLVKAALWI